jgi:hypothetical protein
MALPDNYVPRTGDVLLIAARVRFDFVPGLDEKVHMEVGENGTRIYLRPGQIDEVARQEIRIDREGRRVDRRRGLDP